jgi:hypothetical protein
MTISGVPPSPAVGTPDLVNAFEPDEQALGLALSIVQSQIANMSQGTPTITFSEDGSMTIIDTVNTEQGMKMTMFSTRHGLTPENGFTYNNGIITAPNGTQVFP